MPFALENRGLPSITLPHPASWVWATLAVSAVRCLRDACQYLVRVYRRRSPADRRDLARSAQPLQLHGARLAEAELAAALGELAQERRDEDLPALGLRGDARRLDHGSAEEVVGLLDRLAGVEADAHPDRRLGVPLGVGGEGALQRDGAGERAARALE